MGLENLSALIVCPQLGPRNRLRSVLRSFVYKGRLEYEAGLKPVTDLVMDGGSLQFDLLFLASSIGRTVISDFLASLSEFPNAQIPPMVVFVTDNLLDRSSEVASLYMQGISGFISEPYSVAEVTALLESVLSKKKPPAKNDTQREGKAVEFLMYDAKTHLENLVSQMYNGETPKGYALRDMRRIAETIGPFVETNKELFSEICLKVFEKSQPATQAELQRKVRKPVKVVVHPGLAIGKLMEVRGLSIERLLSISRLEPETFTAVLRGEASIDESICQELSRTLGMTSKEWLKMQVDYDKHTGKKSTTGSASV